MKRLIFFLLILAALGIAPFTDNGHTHSYMAMRDTPGSGTQLAGGSPGYWVTDESQTTNSGNTGITINPSGGGAHAIMNPAAVVNFIIKN